MSEPLRGRAGAPGIALATAWIFRPNALGAGLRRTLDEAVSVAEAEAARRALEARLRATIAAIETAIDEQHRPSAEATLQLHQAEQWRDRLIADDGALTDWMALDPEADAQQLRTLIRQARKDAQAVKERPGEAQRHGKAYREIFQHVKAALARGDGDEPGEKE